MAEPTATLLRDGAVVTVALDRPAAGNALDLVTATLLADLLEGAEWDGVRALVLRGQGRAFCVGGDLREMWAASDRSGYLRDLASAAHRAVRAIARAPMPVIAAVDGAAAGAGLALTLLADVVLAGDRARFVVAYPQVGLTPDCGTSWLLPRVVGVRTAARMALLADGVEAETAVAAGLATRRVASSSLEAELHETLTRIRETSPGALAGTKALLRDPDWYRQLSQHLDREQESIAEIAGTDEAAQRIAAFLER